jgi:hypothetical protein
MRRERNRKEEAQKRYVFWRGPDLIQHTVSLEKKFLPEFVLPPPLATQGYRLLRSSGIPVLQLSVLPEGAPDGAG